MSIQSIRDNSQSLVVKFIIGIIVISFAFFGVDAIVGFSSDSNKVATVNGTDINYVQLAQAESIMSQRILAQMGDQANPDLIDSELVRTQALDNLIARQLIYDDARKQSLHVSDRRTDTVILNTPSFQVNGVFNKNIYESALRRVSMTPLDYKNQIAQELLIRQAQLGISQSDFLTQAELEHIARLDQQLRDVSYTTIPLVSGGKGTDVTDDRILEYYKANEHEFMTQESVSIEYLELKRSDFEHKVQVNEAEIEQRYQQEIKGSADREERRAAHILVEINDDTDAASAQKKIEQAMTALKAGGDFAELAKKYSDDSGSAQNGGDLGFSERGAFTGPFEDTLFAMKEGEVSDIVETEFGLHIIKLISIRKPEIPALETIRDRLVNEIRIQKSEELFVAAVDDLQNDSFSAVDLEEPARNLELQVQSTGPFTRMSGTGIAENEKIRDAAFSEQVLDDGVNSDLIEISPDHVVVVRVKDYQPAALQPLEDVSKSIATILKDMDARDKTRKAGEKIVSELRAGASLDKVAGDHPLQWTKMEKVSRNQTDLESTLLRTIFKLPKPVDGKPSIGQLIREDGSLTIIAVSGVHDAELNLKPEEARILARYITRERAGTSLMQYHSDLEQKADIEKF